MTVQSENERNKAWWTSISRRESRVHLTSFAAYLHPDFTVTAPNYPPWGGRHVGAAFFRDHLLPSVTDVFDFARFSYDNVVAEDGHVVAIFNIGVTGTDAIIKIVDHLTLRDGKVISLWAAYFEPQAVLEKLGIKLVWSLAIEFPLLNSPFAALQAAARRKRSSTFASRVLATCSALGFS
jgi:ketosteroid isomerase-like protein